MSDRSPRHPERKQIGAASSQDQEAPQRITTIALMRGGKRVVIEHNDQDYVLQITRSGRLILTK